VNARRNPDGDSPLWHRLGIEAKCVIKRRLAPRGTPVLPPDTPYLVVPVLGQSNAQGMGVGLDLNGADRPHPRVHQWAMCGPSKGTAILAADPLLHDVPSKGVGFAVTFGKRLADETGRAVLLVPAARGDTSFAPKNGYTWDPADRRTRVNLYRMAVAAVDAVLSHHHRSTVAAVLWHQGETDVPLTAGQIYEQKLDALVDDLRMRYGRQVPFLLGQMVPEEMEGSHHDYSVINAVHADTPNRRSRTAFVAGPRGCINGGEDRHYNAAGQRRLGAAMWDAYRSMCADEVAVNGVH
jgi:Carbohydrate esterase, sialic acid-specific acetylesterase